MFIVLGLRRQLVSVQLDYYHKRDSLISYPHSLLFWLEMVWFSIITISSCSDGGIPYQNSLFLLWIENDTVLLWLAIAPFFPPLSLYILIGEMVHENWSWLLRISELAVGSEVSFAKGGECDLRKSLFLSKKSKSYDEPRLAAVAYSPIIILASSISSVFFISIR
jgi:hypothetical protein